jgi:hypothetical protein
MSERNPQFQRTFIYSASMTQSVCRICSDVVGYSSRLSTLSTTEAAHKCALPNAVVAALARRLTGHD